MSADLVGYSLAIQSVLCAAAVLGIWKLNGESSFGKRPQEEVQELHAKLLRALSQRIVSTVEEALVPSDTVDIAKLILPNHVEVQTPKVAELGKERLRDGVGELIKSDICVWRSLRILDHCDKRISNCLRHLRRVALALSVFAGISVLAAGADKFRVLSFDLTWIHVSGLAISSLLIAIAVCCASGVTLSTNRFEDLKEKHEDL